MRLAKSETGQSFSSAKFIASSKDIPEALQNGISDSYKAVATAYTSAEIGASVGTRTIGRAYRSNIQEAIIAASDRRCETYKITLSRAKSGGSFLFSAAATAVGTAGALVSGGVAPYLSGASGAISGIGAAADQAVFQGQLVDLLVSGMDISREEMRRTVLDLKRDVSLRDYPLEQAVGLAIQYGGKCSMPTALQAVKTKLKEKVDPNEVTRNTLVSQYRVMCAQEVAIGKDKSKTFETCNSNADEYLKALGGTTSTSNTSTSSTTSTATQ